MKTLPNTWGPVTAIAVVFATVGAITGAVVTITGGLDFQTYFGVLMGTGSIGMIARGLWGRTSES